MARVNYVIGHIRRHIIAESSDSDPTQVVGVEDRAQLVLDAIESLRGDLREISLRDLLIEIHDLIPDRPERDSFRRAMAFMRDSGARTPWVAIHEWVAREQERFGEEV